MKESDEGREIGRAVVTGGKTWAEWQTKAALRGAVPDADVIRTDFHAVYRVEAEGDVERLCRAIVQECGDRVGHVTALLSRVDTAFANIRDAAVELALREVGAGQTFAFRIHKRGARTLDQDTPELEERIGTAIWKALEERHGEEPEVELESPDVRIVAEVFGPDTWIGIWRKRWSEPDDT